MSSHNFNEIDQYIQQFPKDIQERLNKIRTIISQEAPDAIEKISYQMPTFYLNGNLVQFAAFNKHIGFYPSPSGITHFESKLAGFQYSKGAIQFPNDKELPTELIKEITRFRVIENLAKNTKKSKA